MISNWNRKNGHLLYYVGIIAIAYGVIQFLMINFEWPSYAAWIAGGLLILVITYFKKGKKK